MRLTDWRGFEYGVGSTILYPRASGRSVEISEAVVEDIYRVYYDTNVNYGSWVRLEEGHLPPEKEVREWQMIDGRRTSVVVGHEFERTATRVKVKPTGLGSRSFYRGDWKTDDIKSVTISNIENISVVPERLTFDV